MLGKLFKYEWKTVSKMGLLMLGAIAVVTLLGVLGFVLPVSTMSKTPSYSDEDSIAMLLTTMVSMVTMMVYIVTLMGVVYGMLVYLGVHFYKTMYSDEGYLTMTLPVTPRQLIISKVVNGGIWYAIISVGMVVSIFVLVFAMMFSLENTVDVSREMQQEMSMVFTTIWENLSFEVVHIIGSMLLALIVTPFSTMMTLFGAITIGQLASKYRALMGILAYFGVSVINGVVSYIISFLMSSGYLLVASATETTPSPAVGYDAMLISSTIMLVVFYFVSLNILNKKLNME